MVSPNFPLPQWPVSRVPWLNQTTSLRIVLRRYHLDWALSFSMKPNATALSILFLAPIKDAASFTTSYCSYSLFLMCFSFLQLVIFPLAKWNGVHKQLFVSHDLYPLYLYLFFNIYNQAFIITILLKIHSCMLPVDTYFANLVILFLSSCPLASQSQAMLLIISSCNSHVLNSLKPFLF